MEYSEILLNVGIFLGLLLPLIFLGMSIGLAMAFVGIVLLAFVVDGGANLIMVGLLEYNTLGDNYALIALPLFVYMGYLILHIGLAEKIFDGSAKLVGSIPGGLLHANIFSSAIFSAMCGSSVATAASLGSLAIPLEIDKHKYNPQSVMGTLAAGGTLGILIPPSITFILYGVFVGESIGQLFAAGMIPGIVLALAFMLQIYVRTVFDPGYAGPRVPFSAREALLGIYKMWPSLLLIISIIAAMYSGLATPTEAAAVGCTFAMVIGYSSRTLSWRIVWKAAEDAIYTTCFLVLLIVAAQIISLGLTMLEVPQQITDWVVEMGFSPLGLYVALVAMYLVLGMFLEPASMLFLTLPVVYPLMTELGFSSIWLGVVLVILVELADLTPPVGFNLFVIQGVSNGRSIGEIVRGVIPYWFTLIAMLGVLYIIPEMATWLPKALFGY